MPFFKRNVPITFLAIIVLFAFIIRTYELNSIPQGVLDDEASHGYIAYSLLHTQKDERGNYLPLHFEAFGDEKLPAYPYILTLFISIFDLNNFSTRFPSALAGSLLVLVIYGLLRSLDSGHIESLFASMLVAFSPWSIVLSRLAFESNVALLFFTIGLWTMFLALKNPRRSSVLLTIIFFAATWYTYIPYRWVTSFFVVFFIARLWTSRIISFRHCFMVLVLFLLLILPLIPHSIGIDGTTRLRQIGLYNDSGIKHMVDDKRGYCMQYLPQSICVALANRPFSISIEVIFNVIRSLSPEFLFLTGEKNILYLSVPNWGVLLLHLLPFYIFGLMAIFTRKPRKKFIQVLVLISLIIVTLPSAMVGMPQRVRLSALLPFIVIVITYGYGYVSNKLQNSIHRNLLFGFISFITLGYGFAFLLEFLYFHIPKFKIDYESDVPSVMRYIHDNANDELVYFEKFNNNFPILYAYHNKINPEDYQNHTIYSPVDSGGFSHPVEYKNIKRADKQLSELICIHKNNGTSFWYVSTEKIQQLKLMPELPVFTELSGDKQSTIVYIYRIDPATYQEMMCDE
ncbi:MAG TPA: glycosyltransferase family 39 protein [Candidatus Woesebacteria bacterium]|nr:glycosyltransferase family 39 protein [Candidatus Woesebacteria bacterium]